MCVTPGVQYMGFTSPQLAQAALVGQMGGAATSAIGSYFSSATQKASLKGQAAIADTNARIAELGAQSVLSQGQHQVAALTLQAGHLKSGQRTAMAANGIDLGAGSAAEIQASTDIMKDIDKYTLEANAVRNAWGYRAQSVNFQNEALTKRTTANAISPFGATVSSLLGSASSVASTWYAVNKSGALKGSMFELG